MVASNSSDVLASFRIPSTEVEIIEILMERAHKIKRAVNESLKLVTPACAQACAQAVTTHTKDLLKRIASTLLQINALTEAIT